MSDPDSARAAAEAANDTGFWAAVTGVIGAIGGAFTLGRKTARADHDLALVNDTAARVTEIATSTSQAAASHIVAAVDRLIAELREQRTLIETSRTEMHGRIDNLYRDLRNDMRGPR